MQVQRQERFEKGNCRGKPRTPEEKACYAEWLKTAACRNCKEVGHLQQSCPKKAGGFKQNRANQAVLKSVSDDDASTINGEVFMATLTPTTYIASNVSPRCHTWVMDSGCSHHMTPTCNNYISYNSYTNLQTVQLANKSHINAIREGTVLISTVVDGITRCIQVEDIIHAPELECTCQVHRWWQSL